MTEPRGWIYTTSRDMTRAELEKMIDAGNIEALPPGYT